MGNNLDSFETCCGYREKVPKEDMAPCIRIAVVREGCKLITNPNLLLESKRIIKKADGSVIVEPSTAQATAASSGVQETLEDGSKPMPKIEVDDTDDQSPEEKHPDQALRTIRDSVSLKRNTDFKQKELSNERPSSHSASASSQAESDKEIVVKGK
jgi:hypothetical protein